MLFLFFAIFFDLLRIFKAQNAIEYPGRIGGRCGYFQFDCDPGSRVPLCIPISAIRDCTADCPNRSDEWCPQGKILCDSGIKSEKCGQCVFSHELSTHCLDRKWQHLCAYEGTVKCAHTMNCVFQKWLMDGKNDCGDGSDEDICNQGLVQCNLETSTAILQSSSSMPKFSGDNETVFNVTERCDIDEFRCSNGQCLKSSLVLDSKEDCLDGSDENYCEMSETECSEKSRCSFQRDISAFGCGCPRGFDRSEVGICELLIEADN
ncbi:unnamed protein product [Caenorhabditis angaria]|uniref:EGF-like domain-containing protein n=1 Tax=Caenorhabditis angaria TaxID=860376 RepID=A0A9P1IJI9_9PELO|nr:unnamed protein product [Caenorhabditis angaria]